MRTGGKRAGLYAVGSRVFISWAALFPNPVRTPVPHARGPSKLQRPAKFGRDSRNLPGGNPALWIRLLLGRGKARILGISSNPNLKAQVSKLRQNRERLHTGWQAFYQMHDALGHTVTEELGRLSQVRHPQGVETHQSRADEVGGYGIIG